MKNNKKTMTSPPSLKYSLISFQQYCNNDIFSQNNLLYTHEQKLYTNARNRSKFTKTSCIDNPFKRQVNISQRNKRARYAANEENEQSPKKVKRSEILNVAPAVIHKSAQYKIKLNLSQRAKTETRQFKNSFLIRSKTETFDCDSESNSFSQKDVFNPYISFNKPKRISQIMARFKKIKVYLPTRRMTNKIKDQQINGWESFFEEDGI